jgi:hypothetical protein
VTEKIKILFLSANPPNTKWIRVDEEAREVHENLRHGPQRDSFELHLHPAVRAGDLQPLLMEYEPHIVHFSGHSSHATKIIFEGGGGKGKQIKTKALVNVFRLYSHHVRMVVLNACLTDSQAEALTQVIDCAVGIDRIIGDQAAVKFAGAFYLALSYGKTIRNAFDSAQAQLDMLDLPRSKGLQLFTRTEKDTTIIDFSRSRESKAGPLQLALQDLIANNSGDEKTRLVRAAVLDGSLILDQGEEVAEGALRIFESTNAVGSGKASRAEVGLTTYHRLQEKIFPPPPGLAPPVPGLIVIGREESLSLVKSLLRTPSPANSDLNLTVVRGWPGVGKTTLVGVLGRDPEVLKAFPDGVLWTALERGPELMTKLADWGRTLGTDDLLRTPTVEEGIVKLAALLRHRRLLLIVDDIWKASDAVPFMRAATQSRCAMLATTRLTKVADELCSDGKRVHILPVLTEENSIILLRYLAPEPVDQYPEECRELVSDLGYLPLALHVAGRLLKAEAKMGLSVVDLIAGIREGAKFLKESAPLDYKSEGSTRPSVHALLMKSTDSLDEFTRDCFAFLGPFAPKPATFDAAAMKDVWQVDDPAPVIRKLVAHGLLEPVGASRFQMHELLVKHANSLLE